MTRDQFDADFLLLDQITEGAVRTFHARAATGAVVMVHFLAAEPSGAAAATLAQIESLDPDKRRRILKVVEVEGEPVLVTKFILDFESLHAWLGLAPAARETSVGDASAGPISPPASGFMVAESPATPPDADEPSELREPLPAEPGEFTRLFRSANSGSAETDDSAGSAAGSSPDPSSSPLPEDAPLSDHPAASGAGEFTRLFSTPAVPPPTSQPKVEDVSPEPTPHSADAPAPESEPMRPASPAEPGEFTRMFRLADEPTASARRTEPPPAAPPTPGGELTGATPAGAAEDGRQRPLDSSRSAAAEERRAIDSVKPAPSKTAPGEYTRVFGTGPLPGREQSPARSPAVNPEAAPPPAVPPVADQRGVQSRESSEFTRMFGRSQIPAPAETSPPVPPSSGHATDSNNLPADWARQVSGQPSYLDRLHGSGAASPARGTTPDTRPSGPPPPQPTPTGPGEFTRMISTPVPPPPAAPVSQPSAPAASTSGPAPVGKRPSETLLLVGFGVVILLAVVLVLLFALRSG